MHWRFYCGLRLNPPRRGKKRLPARIKQPLEAPSQPNQGWSCDLMSDALLSGGKFRTSACSLKSTPGLSAARVIRALNELVEVRGAPP